MPEICTLDCGTMNFGEGDYVMTNSTSTLKEMARQIQALGVRPEIEAFDTGHLWQAKSLAAEGLIDEPAMIQLCMGVPWGAPPDINTFMAMVNNVPDRAGRWSAFSLGRRQMEYVALATIAGGNIRVGLEDNLYLGQGPDGDERRPGRPARSRSSTGSATASRAPPRSATTSNSPSTHDRCPHHSDARCGCCVSRTIEISSAAAVGCGVIGAGWVARLRLRGVDVSGPTIRRPTPRGYSTR